MKTEETRFLKNLVELKRSKKTEMNSTVERDL